MGMKGDRVHGFPTTEAVDGCIGIMYGVTGYGYLWKVYNSRNLSSFICINMFIHV